MTAQNEANVDLRAHNPKNLKTNRQTPIRFCLVKFLQNPSLYDFIFLLFGRIFNFINAKEYFAYRYRKEVESLVFLVYNELC